jgi:chromosome segregation ATPase
MAMMARSVGMPKIPVDTPANRRLAMEEMCSILCRHDEDAQAALAKYDDLKAKYRRSKKKVSEMRARCSELSDEIDRNRKRLADHMDAIHRQEQTVIDEKLARLEEMVSSQIEAQKRLISTRGTSAARRSQSAAREPGPRPPIRRDDVGLSTDAIVARKRKSVRD